MSGVGGAQCAAGGVANDSDLVRFSALTEGVDLSSDCKIIRTNDLPPITPYKRILLNILSNSFKPFL